jgi:hypothetical protein
VEGFSLYGFSFGRRTRSVLRIPHTSASFNHPWVDTTTRHEPVHATLTSTYTRYANIVLLKEREREKKKTIPMVPAPDQHPQCPVWCHLQDWFMQISICTTFLRLDRYSNPVFLIPFLPLPRDFPSVFCPLQLICEKRSRSLPPPITAAESRSTDLLSLLSVGRGSQPHIRL